MTDTEFSLGEIERLVAGTGNYGGVEAGPEPWHGRPPSARITLLPLGVLWLTPET